MTWCVTDLETTIHSGFKRKANPFLRDEDGSYKNWVVMMGWATKADPHPQGIRITRATQHLMTDKFIELLQGTKLLVGVNLKFDLLYLLRDPRAYEAWQDYVVRGGNVWCCQLAEYLLQGQTRQSHMLSLDDMALYYDLDTKVDEVKLLWDAGVQTEDIDPDLLARYLLGEDLKDPRTGKVTGRREGDIGNTRDIFLRQIDRAKAAGQSRSILMNMGSLIASIEMERNGMFVDKHKGMELAAELAAELDEARKELHNFLPANLSFEFNWSNRYHLSPLIFGGVVNYEVRQWDLKDGGFHYGDKPPANGLGVYGQREELHYLLEDGTTISIDEYEYNDGLGAPMPARVQYKSGKNAGEYKTKKIKVDDYTKPKGRTVKQPYTFPGFTVPLDEWESSTPGLYSVSSEVIEELGKSTDVPFLKTLSRVAAVAKDLGTYFITTDEKGEQKGMLTLVDDYDNIVHHGINHTSTVTGRFSASNPNL